MRSISAGLLALSVLCSLPARAQDTKVVSGNAGWSSDWQQIPGPACLSVREAWEGGAKPCAVNEHEAWLQDVRHWREERRIRIGYDSSRYDLPATKWTQSSFIQPQMMVEDRYFYDPVANRYSVDRYLDDLERRYGGIDGAERRPDRAGTI